jgi:hypothetical protein
LFALKALADALQMLLNPQAQFAFKLRLEFDRKGEQ